MQPKPLLHGQRGGNVAGRSSSISGTSEVPSHGRTPHFHLSWDLATVMSTDVNSGHWFLSSYDNHMSSPWFLAHPFGQAEDMSWRLWDVETTTELLLQEGHSRPVYGDLAATSVEQPHLTYDVNHIAYGIVPLSMTYYDILCHHEWVATRVVDRWQTQKAVSCYFGDVSNFFSVHSCLIPLALYWSPCFQALLWSALFFTSAWWFQLLQTSINLVIPNPIWSKPSGIGGMLQL